MTAFRTAGVAETTPCLGLITTGQSPRPDYVAFHRGLLQALGIKVDIRLKCMLDGLTPAAVETLAPEPSDDAIHGYVRSPGSTNQRFGADWAEVWMSRRSTIPLVQACIDDLVRHQVDVIIYCCAEAYPEAAFRATRPLVLPARVLLSYAGEVVATRDRTTIGVLTRGTRQRPQQLEAWTREPWAHRVSLHFELIGDSPVAAARRLAVVKPDLVLY